MHSFLMHAEPSINFGGFSFGFFLDFPLIFYDTFIQARYNGW